MGIHVHFVYVYVCASMYGLDSHMVFVSTIYCNLHIWMSPLNGRWISIYCCDALSLSVVGVKPFGKAAILARVSITVPRAVHHLFEWLEPVSVAALYSWDRLLSITGPMYNIVCVYSIAGLWRVGVCCRVAPVLTGDSMHAMFLFFFVCRAWYYAYVANFICRLVPR